MAYSDGIPIAGDAAPGWIGQYHAPNWVDWYGSEALGVSPQAAMRGQPPPLSAWMRRLIPQVPTMPQPVPVYLHSRPYDRGAQAYSPKFGILPINPIGAGVVVPYRHPTIAGPGARYQGGAIWFDVQTVPTSIRFNPTLPVETVNALLATSHVGPSYMTTG
jgi:hypothetical protein